MLFLDAEGRLVSRRGRTGQGPGDYRFLGGVVRHGDGLVTWDQANGRVTLLDAHGEYVDETRIGYRGLHTTRIIGAFGASVLVEFWPRGFEGEEPAAPSVVRSDVVYEIVDLSDGTTTFEVSLPGEERWVAREEDGRHGGLPVMFGRRAAAAVTDQRAYLATTDSLTLAGYDEMGNQEEIVSLGQDEPVAVRDQWVQIVRDTIRRFIEAAPERVGMGPFVRGNMDFRRRLLTDLPSRSTLPSFSEIRHDTDGRLWIRGYSGPTQDHDVWVRLSEEWAPQRWVEIPKVLNVLDFSEDQVLVWRTGEFLEDIIEVYAIER